MSGAEFGATLHGFSLNLVVRDIARSLPFYVELLGFEELHSADDYAALEGHGIKLQLHSDRTWGRMPRHERLEAGEGRGLGAELRLLGLDPEAVEARARQMGVRVLLPTRVFAGHGWRECQVEDPDGYLWVAGTLLTSKADQGG